MATANSNWGLWPAQPRSRTGSNFPLLAFAERQRHQAITSASSGGNSGNSMSEIFVLPAPEGPLLSTMLPGSMTGTYLKIARRSRSAINVRMIRLTNKQWERIRNHFPEEHIPDGRPGRKPIKTRRVFEAVLWILNTGAQWHMLPQSYPNYKSVHRRR